MCIIQGIYISQGQPSSNLLVFKIEGNNLLVNSATIESSIARAVLLSVIVKL
jgi:hypothetical protein